MAYKLLSDCPVCGDKLKVVKLTCNTCSTTIESEFTFSRFEQLSNEHLQFAEVFIKCGGSIKDVEKELGVSYPTVKIRLNDVIKALGYEVEDEKPADIKNIIDKLESGEITPDDAIKNLKSK